jgi:hypothetical protein
MVTRSIEPVLDCRSLTPSIPPGNSRSRRPLGVVVIDTALTDLWFGFRVVFEPRNLMWCLISVLIGNMVAVLPEMGPRPTISILLPLTVGMKPVGAVLMLVESEAVIGYLTRGGIYPANEGASRRAS